MNNRKSVLLSLVLTFFLGPFGKRLEIVEEEAVEVDYLVMKQGTWITSASIMHVKG
jgi:hypothetical protein